jgi:ankyrin repeat protein
MLLEHGADATAKDKYGSTPLHRAVGSGKEAVARVLLEHGADVTATDRNGWTPSRCAVEQGREDLAHLLIEHGADATAQDNQESTSLHVEHNAQHKHGRLWHLRHRLQEVWYEPIASTLGRT